MEDGLKFPANLRELKTALTDDLARVVQRDRWGIALILVGWIHLAFFLTCHTIEARGDFTDSHYVCLWVAEVVSVVGAFRLVAGPGWYRATPLAGVVVRVWVTFLILAFNAATMNSLTGWTIIWFKPSWATLSSFGFATMAWLFGLRFLIPAFQMYFTGLLMVRFPSHNYLIYGLSWWLALQGIGLSLAQRARRVPRVLAEEEDRRLMAAGSSHT